MKIKISVINGKTGEVSFQEVEAQKVTESLYIHKVEEEFCVYAGKTTVARYWKVTAVPSGFLVWTAKTRKQAI